MFMLCRLGTLSGNDFVSKSSLIYKHQKICDMYPRDSLLESLAAFINSGMTSGAVRLKPGNEVEWIKSVSFLESYADKFAASLEMYEMKTRAKAEIDQVGGSDGFLVVQAMEARARETDNIFPRLAYSVLCIEIMSSGIFLEVPPRIPAWQVYKTLRRRAYALLFSLKQSETRPLGEIPVETMSLSTVYADSGYCIEGTETPDAEFYDTLPPKYKFSSYKKAVSAPL